MDSDYLGLLYILLGGHQLPLASAWGKRPPQIWALALAGKLRLWLKPNQEGDPDPRAKARGN